MKIPKGSEDRRKAPWTLHLLESIPSREICWEWSGQLNAGGYGVAGGPLAHRRVYALFFREIPESYHLHHVCGNTRCVNPRHMQIIAPEIHGAMSKGLRTHCSKGHEYTPENTTWRQPPDQKTPSRVCLTCKRLLQRNAYRKRRSSAG